MCGLPFAGKSVLARSLSHELGIRLLSYDFEIYLPHRHLVPPGSSVAAEYDFVQDIARRQIGAFLAAGESLIYDDLLLGRDDRRKLAAVARHHRADFVLVYLDTPLEVIDQRQEENARTRTRHSVPEGEMRLEASLLEPPDATEQAISVRPGDDLTDVLTRISARLRPEGHASLLPPLPGVTIGWCCCSLLRPAPPTSPGWPRTGSTCWSSGAGSPASGSPWTPRRAACRWPWRRRTTSRRAPRDAPPGWCTGACGTWNMVSSAW
jgi:predicted kinase